MSWSPVIVGVDGSAESVRAAVAGSMLAQRAKAECHLVHAAPDYWAATSVPNAWGSPEALVVATVDNQRTLLLAELEGNVPSWLARELEIRVGRAPKVLAEIAHERQAGLIVLGGKKRRGMARIAGGTIPHMVRTCDVPLLATDGSTGSPRRVLAAVDLSYAAGPTIHMAERFAELFDATLRVMHAVEPMPLIPGFPVAMEDEQFYGSAVRALDATVWPLIAYPRAETVIRRGRSAAAILNEVRQWGADLLVVGSHGKGWVDRLLIGSTSERLLQVQPTGMLIVPVARPTAAERQKLGVGALPWEAAPA